jgi:molecular chaperone GrpE
MQEEGEKYPDNTVLKELQKGYMIHDRLLRPAMVVVSKKKTEAENHENSTQKKEDE